MTPFLRKIVFFSSGGSFLDGYVLALIGVALTQITPLFDLNETWSALIGASVFLGILIGTVVGGYYSMRSFIINPLRDAIQSHAPLSSS